MTAGCQRAAPRLTIRCLQRVSYLSAGLSFHRSFSVSGKPLGYKVEGCVTALLKIFSEKSQNYKIKVVAAVCFYFEPFHPWKTMSNVNVCARINSAQFCCQATAACEFHYCRGGKQKAGGGTKMLLMLRCSTAAGSPPPPCGCSDIERCLMGRTVVLNQKVK